MLNHLDHHTPLTPDELKSSSEEEREAYWNTLLRSARFETDLAVCYDLTGPGTVPGDSVRYTLAEYAEEMGLYLKRYIRILFTEDGEETEATAPFTMEPGETEDNALRRISADLIAAMDFVPGIVWTLRE